MSDTKVDMPTVCQMFDSGWQVLIYKDGMGSYTAEAKHANEQKVIDARKVLADKIREENPDLLKEDWDGSLLDMFTEIETADFTPEQTLTRLAYKIRGEIL